MQKQPAPFLPAILSYGTNMLTATAIASAGGLMMGKTASAMLGSEAASEAVAFFLILLALSWTGLSTARLHQEAQLARAASLILVAGLLFTGAMTVAIVFNFVARSGAV